MSTDSRRDGTSTVVPGGERVFFSCYIYRARRKAPSDARGMGGGGEFSQLLRALRYRCVCCARFSQQLEQFYKLLRNNVRE
jgi:hypothetical protein